MLSDTALAEAARYCDNDLALVLGERLSALTDAQEELEALQILYDRLVAENNALLDDMEATLDAEIALLEAAIAK